MYRLLLKNFHFLRSDLRRKLLRSSVAKYKRRLLKMSKLLSIYFTEKIDKTSSNIVKLNFNWVPLYIFSIMKMLKAKYFFTILDIRIYGELYRDEGTTGCIRRVMLFSSSAFLSFFVQRNVYLFMSFIAGDVIKKY